MTRKHFEAIANILSLHAARPDSRKLINGLALDLSIAFKEHNPRFDVVRFLNACGLEQVTLSSGEKKHIIN